MRSPAPFWDAWPAVRNRIGKQDRLVLLADFDGTLAQIAALPEQARLPQSVRRLLAAISARGVLVGVVSGRSLDDIRSRVGIPGIWYVGTHGFALCSPTGRAIHLASPVQRRIIARVAKRLDRRLGDRKGVVVEKKGASVAVHYRNASRKNAAEAIAAVRDLGRETPRLRLLSGKKVVELLPAAYISKWTALQRILRDGAGRKRGTGRRLIFYLGDDSTDEAVFERLDGISIAVGKSSHTQARYFLKSPAEVRRLLGCVLEALA
jgi:trehalose-phosphatase